MSLVPSPTIPPEQARVSEPVADQVARAAVLRRLELEVVRRLDGRVSGEHHTTAIGPAVSGPAPASTPPATTRVASTGA